MNHVSRFRRLEAPGELVDITVDGHSLRVAAGDSVAAALFAAGYVAMRRTAKSDLPRGPYCMMGACFECQMRINGTPMQACMTPVSGGMDVRTIHKFLEDGDA